MKTAIFSFLVASLIAITSVNGAETLAGKPTIVNSTTLKIGARTLTLANIVSLKPGYPCMWKNRLLDCGVLATAGLKDLVAGADKVVCSATGNNSFTCRAGGYDLGFGLIHAGWAVPTGDAPAHYREKMARSKKRGLGLWGATNPSKQIIADQLTKN